MGDASPAAAESALARTAVIRARLGVGIVLVFGLISGARGLHALATGAAGVTSYGVITERFDAQYEALRSSLPARGTIGFVSGTHDDLAYVLAHYDLAPLIVKRWPNEHVVVGHFVDDESARQFLDRQGPGAECPPDAVLHAVVVAR